MTQYCLLLLSLIALGLAGRNELYMTSDCICPGQTVTYFCSISGGRFTVWSGTIMESNCMIVLPHNEFASNTSVAYCNSGAVVGRGVSQENDCYTSTLSLAATSDLEGRTIVCQLDNVIVTTINTTTLFLTRDPFSSPTGVRLSTVEADTLTFTWDHIIESCSSLNYEIISENCGFCLNMTSTTQATCTNFTLSTVCTFKVNSVICGNLTSTTQSNMVTVNLRVPASPLVINVLPYYTDSDSSLQRLVTTFSTVEAFEISEGIDGSPTSYTIIYSDANSGMMCGSTTIPPSVCQNGLCSDMFNISSSLCSPTANIAINVFATNPLGNGSALSEFIDGANNLVDVTFVSANRSITCLFLNQPQGFTKRCSVNIAYGENCEIFLATFNISGPSNLLPSPSIGFQSTVSEYCFTVTATSGNKTVVVERRLNLISSSTGISVAAAVTPSIFAIIGLAIAFSLIIVITLIIRRFRKKRIPATVRFSNLDEPGSLVKMLKVYEDNKVNIISVNSPWHQDDLKRGLGVKYKENYVHIECTEDQKATISESLGSKIKFLDDNDPSFQQGDQVRPYNAVLTLEDKRGELRKALSVIGALKISILGLNTRSKRETESGYRNNYVCCLCSERKLQKVVQALEENDAIKVTTELIEPKERYLQFFVKNEVGALAKALEVFGSLSLNIVGINDFSDVTSGLQTQLVECTCNQEDRESLFSKLRRCGAVNISVKESAVREADPDYCPVEFSLRDEIGALAAVLRGFNDLGINIIGVNTQTMIPEYLQEMKTVEYLQVEIEFSQSNTEEKRDILHELQATGFVVNAEFVPSNGNQLEGIEVYEQSQSSERRINFGIRHEAGTLVEALKVFAEFGVNITGIKDIRQDQTLQQPISVEYQRNFIVFRATTDQEAKLQRTLKATGLAVDLMPFKRDDLPLISNKSSSNNENNHSTSAEITQEMSGNEHHVYDNVVWELANNEGTNDEGEHSVTVAMYTSPDSEALSLK